jgi:nucleotide-binding universal stress UspA family protein
MSIVCATNFSDAAQVAATAAATLAAKAGVPLWLVHVLPAENVRAFGRSLLEAAEGALESEAKRLERLGARVERELLTGEAPTAIETFAQEQKALLVVTAASSHATPFLGVGGTVDRLAQSLTRPLLIVRDTAPFEAWAKGTRPLKVMLGVDRSLPFEACRDWVRELRTLGPVEIVATRIFWPHEEYQRLGLPRPMAFGEVTKDLRHALEREVTALVEPLARGGQPLKTRIELGMGRIADHLVGLAEEEGVDLLVVGTHHRKALAKMWSVSHHALRLAKMAVAAVPSTAAHHGAEVPVPAFREVLVATDFSETGDRAVPYAFSLLPTGGTVHLVHVAEAHLKPEQEREVRERLERLVPGAARQGGPTVRIDVLSGGDAATLITQAAERFNVDALCMGSHGHTGLKRAVLGSVAEQVMARTDRPVLVVRPPVA